MALARMSAFVVIPYCVEWPKQFDSVREALLAVFAPVPVVVEHIGSTSVPGLAAKPVIDVLLGAGSLADIEAKIEPLSELGYSYVSKYERKLPMRRYFVKAAPCTLRVHLHAVELGSRFWQEHLAFRDALRSDPALRDRYQALKLRLATECAHDKADYTAAKSPFIQSVLSMVCLPGRPEQPI